MEFKACISKCDNDYRSYIGDIDTLVNSWEDAEDFCRDRSWTGVSYILMSMIHLPSGTRIDSFGEYKRFKRDNYANE